MDLSKLPQQRYVPLSNGSASSTRTYFAGGPLQLETPTDTTLQGTIELPGGVLDLSLGEVRPAEVRRVGPEFAFVGTGRPGTKTDGWEYSYHGNLTRQWQEGVGQRPALVGSVIRVKPHGEAAPAGSVYPFIAVKQ